MSDQPTDLRDQIAAPLRESIDHWTIAEWICCEPIKPGHQLCQKGETTRQMVSALLADDPDTHPQMSPVIDAVMAIVQPIADERDVLRSDVKDLKFWLERRCNWNDERDELKAANARLEAELVAVRAQVDRVRKLHTPKTVPRLGICQDHAHLLRTPLRGEQRAICEECPNCRVSESTVCSSRLTCSGWPCPTMVVLDQPQDGGQ